MFYIWKVSVAGSRQSHRARPAADLQIQILLETKTIQKITFKNICNFWHILICLLEFLDILQIYRHISTLLFIVFLFSTVSFGTFTITQNLTDTTTMVEQGEDF